MRGQRNLYDAYFGISQDVEVLQLTDPTKGRSSELVSNRNQLLSARYYYHMHFRRLRFDDILNNLQQEFFLSEKRIVDVLQEQRTIIGLYMQSKPELKELRKEFSWLVW